MSIIHSKIIIINKIDRVNFHLDLTMVIYWKWEIMCIHVCLYLFYVMNIEWIWALTSGSSSPLRL